ncbi:ABC transporter ATP-binding protein [Patescibacteria group bacterium]|nr:ABC transporter ATP-binding protein [Patescibacteria group bacterium]
MEPPLIQLQGVTKTYKLGDEVIKALDNVDLVINRGESLAVIGPSGSGKSTLSNIIGGLDYPSGGTITVDGRDLSKLNDKDLSRYRNQYVGFIFQSFNLQPQLTALENVILPLLFAKIGNRERRERAESCLKAVGLEDRMHHLPTQLSGGQRQRVAIARALANNPKLIIADEPTGNLDSKKGEEIMQLMGKLNKELGVTLIIITHDMNIAKQAGRTISIHDGVIR